MKLDASVILPCRNDAAHLPLVLAALDRQTFDRGRFEVIVIDNGSTDDSLAVARSWPEVIVLSEPRPSAYLARNRGIERAAGEFLVFLDADTVPRDTWLETMIRTARENDLGLVGGRIESLAVRASWGSRLLAWSRSADRRRQSVLEHGRLSGGNMLVARTLFERYGVFLPVASGGDGEFAQRANPEKRPVPYAEAAVVVHRCDITTGQYLRRAYRVARGQVVCGNSSRQRLPRLPWRPGFRRVGVVADGLVSSGIAPSMTAWQRCQLWAVLWLENWFQDAGIRSGWIQARRSKP